MIRPFRAAKQSGLPRAEVKTVFVQFADGTASGDEQIAEQLRRMLKEEWEVLSILDRTYAAYGREKFILALKGAKLPFELGVGREIEGNHAAIDRTYAAVLRAEQRLARINLGVLE